jgi:hypothetical protein
VCRYVLASRKGGAAEHYRNDPVFAAVMTQVAEVRYRHPRISRKVEAASRSALRGQHLRKPLALVTNTEENP